MGSLTNFPIDQVDSIGVDIEVNNLSDEHFRDVMEELTNHQIPERDKCPLVRRLNASISGYFKSTGDVGFSKMGPVKTNNNSTTNSKPGSSSLAGDLSGGSSGNNNVINSSNQGVDNGNSIELIEYRRTFEYKNYHSPKSCSNPSDIKIKSSERTKGSIGVHSSSTTSATIHNHPSSSSSTTSSSTNTTISNSSSSPFSSSSNVTQNGSRVDSFVNFDSLKHPPCELTIEPSNEPTEGVCLNDNNPTPPALNTSNLSNNNTTNHFNTINSNTIINNITNDNLNNCNKDVNKDTNSKDTTNNKEGKDNSNNTNQATTTANNDTNNNTKGNRNGKEKKKKGKDKNLYKTVYTARDIDGHIGDKPIEDLVYYVTGNKGEIVATAAAAAAAAAGGGLTVATITANVNSGAGGLVTSSNLTTTTSTNLITGVNNPGPITVSASGIGVTPASSVLIGVVNNNNNNNNNNNGASVQCGSYCDNKLATISKSNKESGNVGGKVKKKEKPSPISSTSVAVSATPSSSSLVVVNNSTNIQGRSKKGSNNNNNNQSSISTNNINLDNTSHATSNSSNSVYCASTNGIALISDTNVKKFGNTVEKTNNNNCSVNSGLGKSIPRSSSATTFDSKFSPASSSLSSSNVAQSEVNSSSSMDASSSTSPSLSKSHSIESSSSSSLTVTSMQHQPHQPVTKLNTDPGITVSKSKVKDVHSTTTTNSNVNNNKNSNVVNNNNNHCEGLRSNKKSYTSASSTHVANTANRDLENNNNNENNNFKELRYTASDPETVDQEKSFQPVKSKHLKRRKGVSRNKTVSVSGGEGDLRMSSPSPRSSNTIFTTSNSSSSTSTIPSSVTSSTSNSVNISMTARGYESEKEYCADEYRRRKEYLNHRKLASSMPHSEQNSADNSDMESSCSYPVSGRMPILPTPPVPPASSNNSISSTPKVSYADIAKMGSVIAVTPSVIVAGIGTGTGTSNVLNKGPSPTNITLNSNSVKDANNNISTTGSTETSPKNASTMDSGLSLQTNLSPSTSCSPYPSSSPNCISPSGFPPSLSSSSSSSSSTTSNQTTNTVTLLPEGSLKASSSKNPTNAIAYNQINKSSPPPHSSSESTIDATNLSKDNPPTIKSEINFDQEISSKDGKTIGNITISNQINSAAVAIRPKDFDTPKETKMENREVIYEDYPADNNKINKNDKKMEKTIIQFTSPSPSSFSSSSSTTTSTTTSTTIPTSTTGVTIVAGKTASTAKSSSTSATINSKTLEALLSPPVEKTPTSDMKNINKLSDTRVASIKSDTSSRASMLKKSNSIPGANVKINTINSTYRVNLNESINTNRSKLPISLPPVIMNDDSDGADEIESLFTFGFFDDVTSSSTSSLKNSSSLNFTIKPMSSASTKITSTTTTTITKSTPSTATSPSASSSTIKSSNSMVVMTNRSSTSSSKTPTTVKNNYDNMKINATTSNNANSSVSRVKSTKNASKTNLTHSSATSSSSSTTNTATTTATIAPPPSAIKTANTVHNSVITSTGSTWPSLETVTELPHGKKNSGKDSKSTSGNGNNNPSLEKFIAIKLAEPSTNMDADINTFNYSQTINFIKTAWESVMCQYHRSPDKNNSQTSSSSSTATPATASSTKGADLFCESTIYYKCEICEN